MKKIYLLLMLAVSIAACKKENNKTSNIIPKPIPDYKTTTDFIIIDSMKLDAKLMPDNPNIYLTLNNQVYTVKSTSNDGDATFKEENDGVVLTLKEKNSINFERVLSITIPNKNLNNITGVYDVVADNICVKMQQNLGGNTAVTYYNCIENVTGTIQLNYNASSNTLNGEIKKLKFPFGYYLPLYFESGEGLSLATRVALEASGSKRTIGVTFTNAKKE